MIQLNWNIILSMKSIIKITLNFLYFRKIRHIWLIELNLNIIMIFYACKTANPSKYRGSNVIMKKKYIKLYPFNTVVEVPKWWNRKDIESPKIFKLEPTGSVPALVSNKVYTRNTGIVSADHCNHRSPLKTYKLVALKKPASQTTKKPTTKKETKASLMKEAQALGIKGRSKMSKEQLKEAIKNFSSIAQNQKHHVNQSGKHHVNQSGKHHVNQKGKHHVNQSGKHLVNQKENIL